MLAMTVLTAAAATVAHADLDDPGTIILGGGGGYGLVTGSSRYGSEFGDGGNFFFTGKFMVSRRTALAVYFQNQSFAAEDLLPSLPVYKRVAMVSYEVHGVYYFNRVADASRYVDVGIGMYRPELRTEDIETAFPPTGFLMSATLGVETFIRPQMSLDLAIRGVGYFGKGYTDSEELSDDVTEEDRRIMDNTGTFSTSLQGQVALLFYLFD